MKKFSITLLCFVFAFQCLAQTTDSIQTQVSNVFDIKVDSITGLPALSMRPQPDGRQPVINIRGNISIVSTGLNRSFVEELILTLESQECEAVRIRDQATLQRLWSRDFTLDQKQTEVVSSSNALPAYLSYNRMIEKINVIDSNTVYTSGFEYFQEFKNDLNVTAPTIQKYFHEWSKVNGVWKLTTKRVTQ